MSSFSATIIRKRSKYLAMLSAAVMIISFMAVTGLSPSMSRAGLVRTESGGVVLWSDNSSAGSSRVGGNTLLINLKRHEKRTKTRCA